MKVHVEEIRKLLEMQRDCALRIFSRGRLTSFSVEYKTGNQSLFQYVESFTKEEQWIREVSFTRRPDSGHPRQTSRREDRHIIRNARVQPTASSAAIQIYVAPSFGAPVSSQTIRRRLAEGHLRSRHPLHELLLKLTNRRASVWSGASHEETGLQRNGTRSSLARNLDLISAVMAIVFVCGDPVVNVSILSLLYSDTPLQQLV
ncbi:HTH_Tnp_Tc3_2 domain-containing protein [Trichonephila clavipes]|nr:HTH_Tnp_Tc3_2 domain-containing protein [Trichonephila clavipes]